MRGRGPQLVRFRSYSDSRGFRDTERFLPAPVERGATWRYLEAAGRFRGIAFQADEAGYPADQLELIAEVCLRDELQLVSR